MLSRTWHAFLVAAAVCTSFAQSQDSVPARKAAESWLPLVDQSKYAESWKQSSSSFRESVTAAQWQQALQQVRGPLGPFLSRTFLSSQFVKNPPNSPPGDYFLLQYKSDFAHRRGAEETAIVMYEGGKRWLVAGYFVK